MLRFLSKMSIVFALVFGLRIAIMPFTLSIHEQLVFLTMMLDYGMIKKRAFDDEDEGE